MARWLAALGGLVLVAAGALALVLFLGSRDSGEITGAEGPGRQFPSQCADHRRTPPGFEFNSQPPTSGPHRPRLIGRDSVELGSDALLHALELGNVVIAYPSAQPPGELAKVQQAVSGPYDAEIAAAGQAVILGRRPDVDGVVALAWGRQLEASSPDDPALRRFVEQWLGNVEASTRDEACRPS